MKRLLPFVLVSCGVFPDPEPLPDGGVAPARCAALPAVERGVNDGGVSFVAVEGLDFPRSAELCLERGERYSVTVAPHALAVLGVDNTSAPVDVEFLRGSASLNATRGTRDMQGWALAGSNPVTLVISVSAADRAVFKWTLGMTGLGASRAGPVALADGGTTADFEPALDPAVAPLLERPAGGALNVTFNLNRSVEAGLDDARCDPVPLAERYFVVDLDAGSHRITDLGAAPDYRVRALRADGGVVAAGTLSSLATLDLTLARAERIAVGVRLDQTWQTCGFDGGTPRGLVGSARFDLR